MYECPECGSRHDDPGDARLGYAVVCLDCVIAVEFAIVRDYVVEFLPAA